MALVVAAAICCDVVVGSIAAVADATAPSAATAAAAATAPSDPAAAAAAPAADPAAVAPAPATEGYAAIGTIVLLAIESSIALPAIGPQSRLGLQELRSHCKVWQLQNFPCQELPQHFPSQELPCLKPCLMVSVHQA